MYDYTKREGINREAALVLLFVLILLAVAAMFPTRPTFFWPSSGVFVHGQERHDSVCKVTERDGAKVTVTCSQEGQKDWTVALDADAWPASLKNIKPEVGERFYTIRQADGSLKAQRFFRVFLANGCVKDQSEHEHELARWLPPDPAGLVGQCK